MTRPATGSRPVLLGLATRATIVVALLAALAVLAACGGDDTSSSSTSSTTTTPTSQAPAQAWNPGDPTTEDTATDPATPAATLPPAAQSVNRDDPESVAKAVVTIWFSWDTSTDSGPNDAAARSAPLLTPAYAQTLTSTGSASPGADFLTWAQQSAVVTPQITEQPNQNAPDSDDKRYFVFEVTQTGRTSSGQIVGDPVTTSAWVIVTRGDHGWAVSELDQR